MGAVGEIGGRVVGAVVFAGVLGERDGVWDRRVDGGGGVVERQVVGHDDRVRAVGLEVAVVVAALVEAAGADVRGVVVHQLDGEGLGAVVPGQQVIGPQRQDAAAAALDDQVHAGGQGVRIGVTPQVGGRNRVGERGVVGIGAAGVEQNRAVADAVAAVGERGAGEVSRANGLGLGLGGEGLAGGQGGAGSRRAEGHATEGAAAALVAAEDALVDGDDGLKSVKGVMASV